MENVFQFDDRLGIHVPALALEWEQYSVVEREAILVRWEWIRGKIPNRIIELERVINKKQSQLFDEENFEVSCQLNSEIAEIASQINDLHLWYRTNQEVRTRMHA
ncbi:hypothetical protein [Paenibacillus terrigena]|uniref:hypothetical protein n=1 Tax=Paenibacillus terrigena TaxID=369333 RepID=UPI0028D79C11|nr:hypothetical protein [Paenibacillus terrigena]